MRAALAGMLLFLSGGLGLLTLALSFCALVAPISSTSSVLKFLLFVVVVATLGLISAF